MSQKQIAKVTLPSTAKTTSAPSARKALHRTTAGAIKVGDHIKVATGVYVKVQKLAQSGSSGAIIVTTTSGMRMSFPADSSVRVKR